MFLKFYFNINNFIIIFNILLLIKKISYLFLCNIMQNYFYSKLKILLLINLYFRLE